MYVSILIIISFSAMLRRTIRRMVTFLPKAQAQANNNSGHISRYSVRDSTEVPSGTVARNRFGFSFLLRHLFCWISDKNLCFQYAKQAE